MDDRIFSQNSIIEIFKIPQQFFYKIREFFCFVLQCKQREHMFTIEIARRL